MNKLINKFIFYIFCTSSYLLAHSPLWIPKTLSYLLGNIIYYFLWKRRHLMLNNLHHVFPEKSEKWRRRIARISCCRTIEMGMFAMANTYFPLKRIPSLLNTNEKYLDLLTDNEPTVGVAPHFSLMESMILAPTFIKKKIKPIGIIFRPLDHPLLNDLIKQSRERFGIELISRREGFLKAIRLLKNKGAVGVLFDQNAGQNGVLSLFCNRLASLSELPGVLASKFNCKVIALNFIRNSFWNVTIEPVILLPENHNKSSLEITFIINQWLEKLITTNEKSCEDWMWLHNKWSCQNHPYYRLRIESKSNALAETIDFQKLKKLPQCTRFWIRLPNWLGDVIMAIPLIRALKENRPDAEITFIGQTHILNFIQIFKLNDKAIHLPKKNIFYYLKLLRFRKEYPDVQIQFTNSLRGDLEAYIFGAIQRFGISRKKQKRRLLTDTWRIPAGTQEAHIHQTYLWLKYFQQFGLPKNYSLNLQPISLPLKINSQENQFIKSKTIKIGIIAGTENSPEKRWPVQNWIEYIKLLLKLNSEVEFVLYGTKKDRLITDKIQEPFDNKRVKNLSGETNLSEFAYELSSCELVVCNDTGGMHLANALGVKVIGIYGPTNPVRTGPIFEAPKIIIQPANSLPTGGAKINLIKAETVLKATIQILS